MGDFNEETYKLALRKTTHWQSFLLVALGLFYSSILILAFGEIVTIYYRNVTVYVFMGVMVTGLAWTGYIWVNLLRNILATRAYLRSSEEKDLVKSYQQQRLFWRNISIITGLFVASITTLFIFVVFRI